MPKKNKNEKYFEKKELKKSAYLYLCKVSAAAGF